MLKTSTLVEKDTHVRTQHTRKIDNVPVHRNIKYLALVLRVKIKLILRLPYSYDHDNYYNVCNESVQTSHDLMKPYQMATVNNLVVRI